MLTHQGVKCIDNSSTTGQQTQAEMQKTRTDAQTEAMNLKFLHVDRRNIAGLEKENDILSKHFKYVSVI